MLKFTSFPSYLLSFSLVFAPLITALTPSNAFAESETVSNNQTDTYNYIFNNFVTNTLIYNLFAGNVGLYTSGSLATDGSASVNNNIFYVKDGAGLGISGEITSDTSFEMIGSAGQIAILGDVDTLTATGNTSIMDAPYYDISQDPTTATELTNFITNLAGAYISINAFPYTFDEYVQTTLGSVNASNNSVTLTNGIVGIGMANSSGTASYVNVGKFLTGAFVSSRNINSDAQFTLNNNSVLVEGGFVTSAVGNDLTAGAFAGAHLNTVTGNATMSENSVTITGGNIQATTIYGAVFSSITFDTTLLAKDTPTADDSEKNIYLIAGFENNNSTATMFNNSVTISDTGYDFYANLISGAHSRATSSSTLYNNSVNISGGNFISNIDDHGNSNPLYITGAYILPKTWCEVNTDSDSLKVPDGTTVSMNAYNNSVNITGGTINGTVAGVAINASFETYGRLEGDFTYNATLSNNTVSIYGGTIESTFDANNPTSYNGIYGAVYQGQDFTSADETKHVINNYSITNNTVNIGFSAMLGDKVNIGGGAFNNRGSTNTEYFVLTPNVNTYDGNTFHLNQIEKTLTAGTVANFENYQFTIGAETQANETLMTVESLYLGNGYSNEDYATENEGTVATKYASVTALNVSQDNTMQVGDTITLIDAETIDGTLANSGETIEGSKGMLLTQYWGINQEDTNITATLARTSASEDSKVLSEASLGSMSLLNVGADLIAGQAIESASVNVQEAQGQAMSTGVAYASFGEVSGGSSRYNTGSHVDVDSISLVAGIAAGSEFEYGNWLLGGFFEYNYGDYNTHNSFSNATTVLGNGKVEASGGGAFSRFDINLDSSFSPYIEGSLRMGTLRNKYYSGDVEDTPSSTVGMSYTIDNTYYGTHLTLGNVYTVNERISLDTALTYLWAKQDSVSTHISGHAIDFDAVNSHRLRLSGRANYDWIQGSILNVNTYAGLGYEHEFDGDAVTYVDGYKAPVPSLKGGTGISELGVRFVGTSIPLVLDLGVQGYVGLREGVSGSFSVKYTF